MKKVIFFIINLCSEDAKIAKAEVNLMSLLSTLDGISVLQPDADEKEEDKEKEEAPKLPRTNSLEDLGIKVLQFIFSCCQEAEFHYSSNNS